ncbi:MAG: hypothetical protein P8Y25_15805, partial [Chromatiaceae bacterium]
QLDAEAVRRFQSVIRRFAAHGYRTMPWRQTNRASLPPGARLRRRYARLPRPTASGTIAAALTSSIQGSRGSFLEGCRSRVQRTSALAEKMGWPAQAGGHGD